MSVSGFVTYYTHQDYAEARSANLPLHALEVDGIIFLFLNMPP